MTKRMVRLPDNVNVPGVPQPVTVLDVDYLHLKLPEGDDLFVTEFGLPHIKRLLPGSFWTDEEWFARHSVKLFGDGARFRGSSTVYRVRTKEVDGRAKDIVIKWNRMGQDVPGWDSCDELLTAEFNSPFEEFAVLMEMRNSCREQAGRILTHKPLAIYVPPKRSDLDRLGRKEDKMKAKVHAHMEIAIDMFRPYSVIYEWIKGVDAAEACQLGALSPKEMQELTLLVAKEMMAKGFVVRDRKPNHVIVRLDRNGGVKRDRAGLAIRAAIDFELLQRTQEREERYRGLRRKQYIHRQVHRFDPDQTPQLPPHLAAVRIFGVDYIYGKAESTGGALWVVGKDPSLFDYFLPERWEHTPRTKLSNIDDVYETTTKDNIHLVWRLSRVGNKPDADPFKSAEKLILDYGYNSPFEEVAFAIELDSMGVATTFPRAIYETGYNSAVPDYLLDESRYRTHDRLLKPDGSPLLRKDKDYIVIWGYWNKPDKLLDESDSDYYEAIDALRALREGIITEETYFAVMRSVGDRLTACGMEDLDLRGNHKLLSRDTSGQLLKDASGLPEARICHFELLRRLGEKYRG